MTEADLVLMLSEYTNRLWVLQSWFASISMALFTAAYFIGRKLTLSQLVFVLVTYVLYFTAILLNLGRIGANIRAAILSLQQLDTTGVELSLLAHQLFNSYSQERNIFVYLVFDMGFNFLLFFGAIGYLVHQFRSGRRVTLKEQQE